MVALSKSVGLLLAGVAAVLFAVSARALEAGQCGPIADIGAKLSLEGQSAFGKGRRLTTAEEMKSLHIEVPLAFGMIFFSSSDRSKGYIAKTEVILEAGPTQMCIDYVIGGINLTDPSVLGSQQTFARSPLLEEHLRVLGKLNERVMFQASRLSKGKPDGTLITVTANMISKDERHKGNGSILFTEIATGNTSRIYDAANIEFTANGRGMLP